MIPIEISAAIIGGLLSIIATFTAVWFGHYLSRRGTQRQKLQESSSSSTTVDPQNSASSKSNRTKVVSKTLEEPTPKVSKSEEVVFVVPRVLAGFIISVLAALFWGVGNAVTRWTAVEFPDASLDIALLKYMLAGLVLIAFGITLKYAQGAHKKFNSSFSFPEKRVLISAGLAKGLNTYLWIVAVSLVSATSVATLENLHVVWTALILVVIFRVAVPGSWFNSALIVLIGASLITGVATHGLTNLNHMGFFLGLIAGLSFAVFTIIWAGEKNHPPLFWQRTVELGCFLILCAILIYPIHLVLRNWLGGHIEPLVNLPFNHAFVQAVNGIVGVGLTYLLMNEAIALMKGAGRFTGLLLSLGISFSVLFTLVTEAFWFKTGIELSQWLGIILFSIGFASIRSNIVKLRKVDSQNIGYEQQ